MRLMFVTAAVAAVSIAASSLPGLAQQGRSPQPQPQPQQQAQPAQPEVLPGMFACRTENETCFIAIVTGASQVSVLYTNDPQAEGVEEKPVSVQGSGGAAIDIGQHTGRVVMLTGQFKGSSLVNAAVVDVASPLLSFAIKSMLAGGGEGAEEEAEEEPPPAPAQRQQPRR